MHNPKLPNIQMVLLPTVRLDPDGELLPTDRYMELCAAVTRQSK